MKLVTLDFTKTIEELIKNLKLENLPDSEECQLTQKHNALPIGYDLFCYVFLAPNGRVIVEDDEGGSRSFYDLQILIRILVAGKQRYPQFEKFIPSRSASSKNCPICGGSGILEQSKDVSTGKPGECFICAGLGWVTDETFSEILKNSK